MNKKLEFLALILTLIIAVATYLAPESWRFKFILICAENRSNYLWSDVGTRYYKGLGVARNIQKARYWWEKGAWDGDHRAQRHLGDLLSHRIGIETEAEKNPEFWEDIPIDYEKALDWYKKAASQRNRFAECRLGYFYVKGLGTKRDYCAALEWYKKAAIKGVRPAQNWLGYLYSHGIGIEKEYEKDHSLWHGIALDYPEAVYWYTRAAEKGDTEAQTRLGYLYSHGEGACCKQVIAGVEKDLVAASEWYKKAAKKDVAKAQWALGNLALLKNDALWSEEEVMRPMGGLYKSLRTAFEWYGKAAGQGYAPAQRLLGYMHYTGQGVEKDLPKAFAWSMKAAVQGDLVAQCQVGYLYEHGNGVTQDQEQALAWYTKAAEQGNELAQFYAARLTYRISRAEDGPLAQENVQSNDNI